MIKSKTKKRYYGTKAYADGYLGKVVSHSVKETADGMSEEFEVACKVDKKDWVLKFGKIVSIERVSITQKMNVITAIVRVDGRTYVGNAIMNPKDIVDNDSGRKLALARALKDTEVEEQILNWINEQNYYERKNPEFEADVDNDDSNTDGALD